MNGIGVREWPLGVDLFLMTLAGGLLILLNLRTLHHWSAPRPLPLWADLVAPVAIIAGSTLLALDMGAQVQGVTWLVVLATAAAFTRLCQRSEVRRLPVFGTIAAAADRLGRGLAWLSVLVGVSLGLYAGSLLAGLPARPEWSGVILPVFFLGYGLAGAAGVLVLARARSDADAVRRTEVLYLAIALALGAAYIFSTGSVRSAVELGWFGVALWGLGLGAGLALPLVLAIGASAWRGLRPLADRATPWLILLGGLVLRQALTHAAQGRP